MFDRLKGIRLFDRLKSLFGLGVGSGNLTDNKTRRKYVRHQAFNAQVIICGKDYNVHDWSMGGVAFESVIGSNINVGDDVEVVIKFSFTNNDITIIQKAHIVRLDYASTAAEFDPLPSAARNEFDRILELLYTQSFIESQM